MYAKLLNNFPLRTAYGLQGYFIILVWSYFFFFWMTNHPQATERVTTFLFAITPFVAPFLLWKLVEHGWFEYVREKKYWEREYAVLEIRIPEEITQSPYAAELMLRGLYQTGDVDTPIHEFWGNVRPWFSLEIASDGGRVKFYIWCQKRHIQLVESQVYAHYPTVQVIEVPDYTLKVPYDPAVVSVWGIEQALQKPDPYPIYTYVEMGYRQDMKEEFKHDPLASVIEFLGQLQEGEHVWIQFVIRAHGPGTYAPYAYLDPTIHKKIKIEEWEQIEIDKILEKFRTKEGDVRYGALTKGDRDAIEFMQSKLNKQAFDVGIRALYIAKNEVYNSKPRTAIPTAFRSFEHGSEGRGLNGLRPIFWVGPFNFAWHDFMNIRRHMLWKRFYKAYVTRQYFFAPHRHTWIVLNSEELATLYHFPGKVVHTPTLERMPSRRGEAPANLPV